jgi:hypothetical protein
MMQVMDIRQIGNAQSTHERYRLLLLESVVSGFFIWIMCYFAGSSSF